MLNSNMSKTMTSAFEFSLLLDNDAMIGNMNMIEERKAKKGLKSKDHIKSRASQLKNVNTNVKISHRIVAKLPGVNSRDHK